MGADIAAREQAEIQQAQQLDLLLILGKPIPMLYIQIDATGIPVVKKETVGRTGKNGQPARHLDVKFGMCVYAHHLGSGRLCYSRPRYHPVHRRCIETAEEFGPRIYYL